MDKDLVQIRFEGKTLDCRPDTTVAVALWENGVRVLSHSPKYGSPRGVTCARGQCTACLMRVDGVPNVRVCELPVRGGMEVARQDTGAFYGPAMQKSLSLGSALFPVGFYYKWFTKPAWVSRYFLKTIRPLTGVGRLPAARALPSAPATEAATRDLGSVETVVIGGGPSGLEAAARAGGRVLVLDENTLPGGQRAAALQAVAQETRGGLGRFPVLAAAHERLDRALADFAAGGAEFRPGSRVIAGYHPDGLLLREGGDLLTLRFGSVVWAAGALDVLGLFPGNDAPGMIGPRALYRMVLRDGLDLGGRRVIVIGGGLDFWLSATLLACRGAHLSLVVTETGWQTEVSAAVDHKWPLHTGLVLAGMSAVGGTSIQATLAPRRSSPGPKLSELRMEGDLAVICNPGKPAYDVLYQLGSELVLQPERGGYLPAGADGSDLGGILPGGRPFRVVGEAAGIRPGSPDSSLPEVRHP
ncbi:(2Fe-2S)-binding protein [bacterium]|nr:(2Fe-2S)-binding protein [bacterium]